MGQKKRKAGAEKKGEEAVVDQTTAAEAVHVQEKVEVEQQAVAKQAGEKRPLSLQPSPGVVPPKRAKAAAGRDSFGLSGDCFEVAFHRSAGEVDVGRGVSCPKSDTGNERVQISKSVYISRKHITAQVTDQGLLVVAERPCAVKWSSGTVTRLATGSTAVLSQGDCIELLYKVGDGIHGAVGIKYEVY